MKKKHMFFWHKNTFVCWMRLKTEKLLATTNQLIKRNCLLLDAFNYYVLTKWSKSRPPPPYPYLFDFGKRHSGERSNFTSSLHHHYSMARFCYSINSQTSVTIITYKWHWKRLSYINVPSVPMNTNWVNNTRDLGSLHPFSFSFPITS